MGTALPGKPGGRGTVGAAKHSILAWTEPCPRRASSHAVLAGPGASWRPPSLQVSAIMAVAAGSTATRSLLLAEVRGYVTSSA
eukprot:2644627-Lingulodinium_polyedra.AAC.1